MSINKAFLGALILVFATLGGCRVNEEWFISHTGNMPTEEKIRLLSVGQTQDEVMAILGTPSSVVSLDKNTWIYMSSDIKQVAFFEPEEVDRDVLTVKFDRENRVVDVTRTSKAHGREIIIAEEKTETLGHDEGFFTKFFGGARTYAPLGGGGLNQSH